MYLNKQEQKALIEVFDIIRSSLPNNNYIAAGWDATTIPKLINEAINRHIKEPNQRLFTKDKLTTLMVYPYDHLLT